MVTRAGTAWAAGGGHGTWLTAGAIRLDSARQATVSFDRDGVGRLTLPLEQPATADDLQVLEGAADALAHLRLDDLPEPDAYRQRHAATFGLDEPLAERVFNHACLIEVVAPGGGVAVPDHLGALSVPARLITLDGLLLPPPDQTRAPGRWRRLVSLVPLAVDATDDALGRAGAWLTGRTRLDAARLSQLALTLAVTAWVVSFAWQTWTVHDRFGTFGFDLGIFDQGTWLLSRLADPFVTVRGLPLFGDHASYVLVLVAPLYWVWDDPRLLLGLQVVLLAAPAPALYLVGARRLGSPAAGLAVAVAYLAFAPMQWAVSWQFHPETLAAGFLGGAILAADRGRPRTLAVLVALALLCKEDIGLVVAGFGATLWITGATAARTVDADRALGRRHAAWGRWLIAAGLAWFLLVTFVVLPLTNGRGSPHLALNFSIEGAGALDAVLSVPRLAGNAVATATSGVGISYLLLIFAPFALLPLAAWRWLLPVAPPVLLNLASTHAEQHKITYQYLATSAPFLALATVAGLAFAATSTGRRLRGSDVGGGRSTSRALLGPLCVLLVTCALVTGYRYGPALWAQHPAIGPAPLETAAREEALALLPEDAGVSAHYHLITHLAHRRIAYEYPNPFRAANWGFPGDTHPPGASLEVDYILVEPDIMSDEEGGPRDLLDAILRTGAWRTVFDRDGVLLLARTAPADPGEPAEGDDP